MVFRDYFWLGMGLFLGVLLTSCVEAQGQGMPAPKFQCDCAVTGECHCGPGCACPRCGLVKERCELQAQIKALKAKIAAQPTVKDCLTVQPVIREYRITQPVSYPQYQAYQPVFRQASYQPSFAPVNFVGGFSSAGCVGGT